MFQFTELLSVIPPASSSVVAFCFCHLIVAILFLTNTIKSSNGRATEDFIYEPRPCFKEGENSETLIAADEIEMEKNDEDEMERKDEMEKNDDDEMERNDEHEIEKNDDELEKRAEEFIERMNRVWRAEMHNQIVPLN
ncbi:hypothetical protein LUZ60_015178 [Juncus effusus]|nr:hypothetical protein LUZ60_015178 [Juncus effusus]